MAAPSLRIRLTSHPPLPPSRVWYDLAPALLRRDTVRALKDDICRDVPAFAQAGVSAGEVLLDVEGFELLDESAVGILKEGDLLSVKARPQVNGKQIKRRRETEEGSTSAPKRRRIEPPPAVLPLPENSRQLIPASAPKSVSTESVEDSSEEESRSSEESDGSSDSQGERESEEKEEEEAEEEESESSSDSSSDSETSSADSPAALPKPATLHPAQTRNGLTPQTPTPAVLRTPAEPVPPGEGKPSTHSRNARRRKRRALLKGAGDGAVEGSGAALEALEVRRKVGVGAGEPAAPSLTEAVDVTLQLREMDTVEHEADGPEEQPFTLPYDTPPPSAPSSLQTPHPPQPEVGSSLSNKNKRKGFKKSMAGKHGQKTLFDSPGHSPGTETGPRNKRPRFVPPSEREGLPGNVFVTSVDCAAREVVAVLPQERGGRGDGVTGGGGREGKEGTGLDWAQVERAWDGLKPVLSGEELTVGEVVAWKELGLNRLTFSPEIMLHLATVVAVSEDGACTVLPIPRPEEVSQEEEDSLDAIEPPTEQTLDASTIAQAGWRHASLAQ
ncbi:hypothetical protein CALCODRAFT_520109 [Calocera cornea HHB12733]|uniref:Coilin n=1 Tax=Calocera cornea HHB12733 TaxID=1353952 RepID=A0A165DRD1_9BASI|nr:hypothetical protein CALCODRAFT_520109 [Calocera cornea HHB12733]